MHRHEPIRLQQIPHIQHKTQHLRHKPIEIPPHLPNPPPRVHLQDIRQQTLRRIVKLHTVPSPHVFFGANCIDSMHVPSDIPRDRGASTMGGRIKADNVCTIFVISPISNQAKITGRCPGRPEEERLEGEVDDLRLVVKAFDHPHTFHHPVQDPAWD